MRIDLYAFGLQPMRSGVVPFFRGSTATVSVNVKCVTS